MAGATQMTIYAEIVLTYQVWKNMNVKYNV